MWLGDVTVGSDTLANDQSVSPGSSVNPYVSLAANLVDIIHPYKQGVPVSLAISPQTQSFLIAGGVLIGGLLILNMVRR